MRIEISVVSKLKLVLTTSTRTCIWAIQTVDVLCYGLVLHLMDIMGFIVLCFTRLT